MLAEILCSAFSLAALIGSLALYSSHAEPAGPALLPLICSCVMLISSVINAIRAYKSGARFCVEFRFSKPVQTVLLIAAFCVSLYFGVPLYIGGSAFVFALMCVLRREKYVQNLIITAVFTGAVYALFLLLFGLELP